MMFNDLTGNKFGKLTVISRADDYISPSGRREVRWKCQCECGNSVIVRASGLKRGTTRSCGCFQKEYEKNGGPAFKHGDSVKDAKYHRLFNIYLKMKQRVYQPVYDGDVQVYGNLTVCDEWLGEDGYKNFKEWSLDNGYQDGLSIDRIDGTKGYSPANCRWTTAKIQSNNRKNMVFLKVGELEMNFVGWGNLLGLSPTTVGCWVRKNGKEWAQAHIEAILNGDESLVTLKKHKRQKSEVGHSNEKFLTVDGITHNYSEWQDILGKDRYGTLISRWVKRHGEEYAITRIREFLNGTEINRRIVNVTYLTVNDETHILSEWDAICNLPKDTISRWRRRNGEDYVVSAIKSILDGKSVERVRGRHLNGTGGKKKYLTVAGITHTLSEWHEIIGLKRYSNVINCWIKEGGEDFAVNKIQERLKKNLE